jgi:hypothetical protein
MVKVRLTSLNGEMLSLSYCGSAKWASFLNPAKFLEYKILFHCAMGNSLKEVIKQLVLLECV